MKKSGSKSQRKPSVLARYVTLNLLALLFCSVSLGAVFQLLGTIELELSDQIAGWLTFLQGSGF